jgi:hypothetical protein
MKRPTIFEANPFLHDPVQYRDFLVRNVASSCAIETGESVGAIAKRLRKYFDEGMPPLKGGRRRSRR